MGYTGSLEREQGKQVRGGGNCIVKFSLSFKQLFTTMYTRCPLGMPIKLPPPSPLLLHTVPCSTVSFLCAFYGSCSRHCRRSAMKCAKWWGEPSKTIHPRNSINQANENVLRANERNGMERRQRQRLMKETLSCPPNEEVPAAWLLTDLQIKHFIEHISEKKDSSAELLIDLQIDHFIDL